MKTEARGTELQAELATMLAPTFPGITVTVEHSERWNRACVTFRWTGFTGLLPEERFHCLVRAIPMKFRKSRMKGVAWLELAPGESTEAFLRLPRSEDLAEREAEVYAGLQRVGFFESLRERFGRDPGKECSGDFSKSEAVLSAKNCSAAKVRDAKLVFIRQGAYCDCQVLQSVLPTLARRHRRGPSACICD